MATKAITMDELLAGENIQPIVLGDTIEGTVMSVKKHEILIDLGARGVGLVPRREVAFGRQLKEGDAVSASGSGFQTTGLPSMRAAIAGLGAYYVLGLKK